MKTKTTSAGAAACRKLLMSAINGLIAKLNTVIIMGVIIEIRYDKHVSFREPIARIRLRGLQVGCPRLILNWDPSPYVTRYNLEYHR